jgi:hypothetical protein
VTDKQPIDQESDNLVYRRATFRHCGVLFRVCVEAMMVVAKRSGDERPPGSLYESMKKEEARQAVLSEYDM